MNLAIMERRADGLSRQRRRSFATADEPLGYFDGPNVYGVETANPVSGTDPMGMRKAESLDCEGGTPGTLQEGGEITIGVDKGTVSITTDATLTYRYFGKAAPRTKPGSMLLRLKFWHQPQFDCGEDAKWIQIERLFITDKDGKAIRDKDNKVITRKLAEGDYLIADGVPLVDTMTESPYHDGLTYGDRLQSTIADKPGIKVDDLPPNAAFAYFVFDDYLVFKGHVIYHVQWQWWRKVDASGQWTTGDYARISGEAVDPKTLPELLQNLNWIRGYDADGKPIKVKNPFARA